MILLTLTAVLGCNSATVSSSDVSLQTSSSSGGHTHDHPSHGPHHGDLIELGNEEFHAELVHDDHTVTIYILDGTAKNSVAIDAPEVVINLTLNGQPAQFKLAANPDSADPEGKSSRFVIASTDLIGSLERSFARPKLAVIINGTAYRGDIKHHHDHGHEHAHPH
ncbi:MAG: hypothetical protein KF752_15495 [Pirellulaceae bacterium]|nr:hypothetical protein [Pirellulaceae bacterium]